MLNVPPNVGLPLIRESFQKRCTKAKSQTLRTSRACRWSHSVQIRTQPVTTLSNLLRDQWSRAGVVIAVEFLVGFVVDQDELAVESIGVLRPLRSTSFNVTRIDTAYPAILLGRIVATLNFLNEGLGERVGDGLLRAASKLLDHLRIPAVM